VLEGSGSCHMDQANQSDSSDEEAGHRRNKHYCK
jgi:hypothetical protein